MESAQNNLKIETQKLADQKVVVSQMSHRVQNLKS